MKHPVQPPSRPLPTCKSACRPHHPDSGRSGGHRSSQSSGTGRKGRPDGRAGPTPAPVSNRSRPDSFAISCRARLVYLRRHPPRYGHPRLTLAPETGRQLRSSAARLSPCRTAPRTTRTPTSRPALSRSGGLSPSCPCRFPAQIRTYVNLGRDILSACRCSRLVCLAIPQAVEGQRVPRPLDLRRSASGLADL